MGSECQGSHLIYHGGILIKSTSLGERCQRNTVLFTTSGTALPLLCKYHTGLYSYDRRDTKLHNLSLRMRDYSSRLLLSIKVNSWQYVPGN